MPEAEALVVAGVHEFVQWLELHTAGRALRPLHELLSAICRREVTYLAGDSSLAARAAERIVARIMAHPMAVLRAASERGEPLEETADALGALFATPRTSSTRSNRRVARARSFATRAGAPYPRTEDFSHRRAFRPR